MASLNVHIPYERIARIAPMMAEAGEGIVSVAARVGCDYIINGGTYDLVTREPDSGLKIDGEYLMRREQHGLGIRADGRLEWSYAGTWCPTWMGYYSCGAVDGKLVGKHLNDRRQRTGVGITEDGIVLAATSGGMTTKDFAAKYFAGCTAWINLDGGASTQWVAPDGWYTTSRKVVWYLCVWLVKDEDKGDDDRMETALPLKGAATITAAFGEKGTYWKDGHKGIDLVCSDGSREVCSACDGVVRVVAYDAGGWGQYVTVGDASGLIHLYAHLVKGSVLVKKGDRVKLGQQIGTMGSTGNSTGVHLHYQVNDGAGVPQDPTAVLGVENRRGAVTPRSAVAEHWATKHYNHLVARGVIDGGDTSAVWRDYDASASTLTVGQLLAMIDKATE